MRAAIRIPADNWLQQRRRKLIRKRNQPDLAEIEMKGSLEDGINRRNQRLHHVIQQMAEADRKQDGE